MNANHPESVPEISCLASATRSVSSVYSVVDSTDSRVSANIGSPDLVGGVVADFGRSCLPGRISRLAATYVHINQSSRPIQTHVAHSVRFSLKVIYGRKDMHLKIVRDYSPCRRSSGKSRFQKNPVGASTSPRLQSPSRRCGRVICV